jgi:AraC-like DNA-binding protein
VPFLIRSASLTDYASLASSLGLDPVRMARRVGIPRACLHDPDIKIRASAVAQLLETSARATNIDDFGMRLAEKRVLSNLGPIGLMVREQPTVRKALDTLIRYGPMHNEALRLRIEESDGDVILKPVLIFRRPQPVNQAMQLIIGVVYRIFRTLLGSAWKPGLVCFSQSAPRSLDACRRLFGTRVKFSADFDAIVCAASDLELPIPNSDAVMARYVQRYLDSIAVQKNLSTTEKVRETACMLLASGNCSAGRVAERLGVDRRTIHRRLQQEGETFTGILDAVRTEMIGRHIENQERPLYAVAELLGFSGLSALSRWFKSQFGCSISVWRRRNIRVGRARAVPLRLIVAADQRRKRAG